jgi:hypothetical protein
MHEGERPWERLGCARRDCEPHRGDLLLLLGDVSMACGMLALGTVLPALVGLPLGIAVIVMAKKDLARMDAGLMDPDGREPATVASIRAAHGARFSLLCWLTAPFVYLVVVSLFRPPGWW